MGDSKRLTGPESINQKDNREVQARNGHRGVSSCANSSQLSLDIEELKANDHEDQSRERQMVSRFENTGEDPPKTVQNIQLLPNTLVECNEELLAQISKYRKLKGKTNKLREENYRLMQERDNLMNDKMIHQFYSERYNYIVRQTLLPYAQERKVQFDERTIETLNFVIGPLLQDATEAGMLRQQVQMLQQELLTREEKSKAISDEQLSQDFRKLSTQIKSLSRLIRLSEELDIVATLGTCILTKGVPHHRWNSRVGTKLFIEAWIWSMLIEMVFRDPFTIFGSERKTIVNLWCSMFEAQHFHGWPRPSPASETWRQTTMTRLAAIIDKEIITHGKTKNQYVYLEQQVVEARVNTIGLLETRLARITSNVDSSQVYQIVNTAFTLAMNMSLQRSRLQITFPRIGDDFCKTSMRSLPTDNGEDDDEGHVAFTANPGLTKWGDVHGKVFDQRFDIVPALVQLDRGDIKSQTGISLM